MGTLPGWMGKWGSPRAHVQTGWQEAQRGPLDLYPRQHHQDRPAVSYAPHTTGQTLSRPEMPASLLAFHPAGSLHRTQSPLRCQEGQDTEGRQQEQKLELELGVGPKCEVSLRRPAGV